MRNLLKTVILTMLSWIRRDPAPKVVFYHDVGRMYTPMGTEETLFVQHMKALRKGDRVCFDDGFRGLYDFIKKNPMFFTHLHPTPIPLTVFLAPRLVGTPGYMSWDEIRELNRNSGVDFQCHTWSHQTLAGPMIDESPIEERTEAWFDRELLTSKAMIAKELGHDINELCFPVGYFSDEVIARCQRAGYQRVYASYPGNVVDAYIQPRCLVQDLSFGAFKAVLKGGMNPLARRYRNRHYCR